MSLNPNFALAYNLRGSNRIYAGQPLEAIPEIEHGMRLDPAKVRICSTSSVWLISLRVSTKQRPLCSGSDLLASALGHLGEFEEARRVWGELKDINPNYTFAEHVGRQPFRWAEDVERIADGLRKARLMS